MVGHCWLKGCMAERGSAIKKEIERLCRLSEVDGNIIEDGIRTGCSQIGPVCSGLVSSCPSSTPSSSKKYPRLSFILPLLLTFFHRKKIRIMNQSFKISNSK